MRSFEGIAFRKHEHKVHTRQSGRPELLPAIKG